MDGIIWFLARGLLEAINSTRLLFVRSLSVFLPARCYASAGTSYDPVSGCSIKRNERINLVFCMQAFLTGPIHRVLRKFGYLQK